MKIFFNQLEQVLSNLNIVNPQQIWNCDESGCQDVPKEDEDKGEIGVISTTQSPRSKVRYQQFSPLLMQWDW